MPWRCPPGGLGLCLPSAKSRPTCVPQNMEGWPPHESFLPRETKKETSISPHKTRFPLRRHHVLEARSVGNTRVMDLAEYLNALIHRWVGGFFYCCRAMHDRLRIMERLCGHSLGGRGLGHCSAMCCGVPRGLPGVKQHSPLLSGVSVDPSAGAPFSKTANITLALFACIFVINVLLIVYVTFHMGALLW